MRVIVIDGIAAQAQQHGVWNGIGAGVMHLLEIKHRFEVLPLALGVAKAESDERARDIGINGVVGIRILFGMNDQLAFAGAKAGLRAHPAGENIFALLAVGIRRAKVACGAINRRGGIVIGI